MKQKLFTLMLAVIASVGAMNAESGTCGDNVTWDLTDGVLTISGTGPMASYFNSTASPWYLQRLSIKNVIIQSGVTSIGASAFYNCSNLTTVTIPNTVLYISNSFYGCSSLAAIEIPNSVTDINDYAFYGCSSLTSVTIPNSVTRIGSYAFSQCYNISSLIIGFGVRGIDNCAFEGCSNLTSVEILSTNIVFGSQVFANCNNLPVIDNIRYADTYLIEVTDKTLSSYVIKTGTIWIGEGAFMECNNMSSVTIPDGVKYIGSSAFYECSGLTSISIPESVTSIDGVAFYGCSGLTSFTIPDSVDNIGLYTFKYCSNLATLVVGKNVTNFERSLMGCDNLQHIVWNAKNCQDFSEDGTPFYFNKSGYYDHIDIQAQIESITFGDEVEYIPAYLCRGLNNLTSITIPKNVKNIGDNVFEYCYSISSVVWNAKHCNTNGNPFSDSRWIITSFVIGNEVEYIPPYLCYGLSSVPDIYIPCSVQTIGEHAFDGCHTSTTTITNVLPDTVICRRGAQICDKEGNCQYFYESGVYSHTYKSVEGCDSTVTYNVILQIDTTFLPDTSVCYGQSVSLSGSYYYRYVDPFENSKWDPYYDKNSTSAIEYFMEYGTNSDCWYDDNCDLFTFIFKCGQYCDDHGVATCNEALQEWLTWYKSHFHDHASEWPNGMECTKVSLDGQTFYKSGTISRSYTNAQGCDSVVTRNVKVIKAVAPYVETVAEQDVERSGKILLYDTYCDQCNRYQEESEGDCSVYRYDFTQAMYDSIKINGKRIDHAAVTNTTPSFNNNVAYCYGKKDDIKNPDYIIDNLAAGLYGVVFYTACDSVVKYITIDRYGIEIDGIYYNNFVDGYSYSYEGEYYGSPSIAYVTYRGTTSKEYEEYSGDVVIPEKISYNDKEYEVKIGNEAFYKCDHLKSITLLGPKCDMKSDYVYPTSWSYDIAYGGLVYGHYFDGIYSQITTIPIYVPMGTLNYYKERHPTYERFGVMNFHVFNPMHMRIESGSTTFSMHCDNSDKDHIVSCGIVDGEEFVGSDMELTGLEPNYEYNDMVFYINTKEGDYDTIHYSFKTAELTLTTLKSKPVSSTTAILLAETNISEAEVNCGFEYKRNDAPADMEGAKVYCPVSNGTMAGRLKNLKDDVYYKYRAFYQSAAGEMYYGDWQYIFTGDVSVEFDPVLYTYDAVAVTESAATLKGYAIAGAEDFAEQGFEYWADSRLPQVNNAPARMRAALGEHKTVQATGIKMQVTLTDLDAGTVYKYRTYAKVGNQVCYGTEMTFTTQGVYQDEEGVELIPAISDDTSRKILHNGQIYILRGDKVYTITGQVVR